MNAMSCLMIPPHHSTAHMPSCERAVSTHCLSSSSIAFPTDVTARRAQLHLGFMRLSGESGERLLYRLRLRPRRPHFHRQARRRPHSGRPSCAYCLSLHICPCRRVCFCCHMSLCLLARPTVTGTALAPTEHLPRLAPSPVASLCRRRALLTAEQAAVKLAASLRSARPLDAGSRSYRTRVRIHVCRP